MSDSPGLAMPLRIRCNTPTVVPVQALASTPPILYARLSLSRLSIAPPGPSVCNWPAHPADLGWLRFGFTLQQRADGAFVVAMISRTKHQCQQHHYANCDPFAIMITYSFSRLKKVERVKRPPPARKRSYRAKPG
jgi:hypothetical protein